MGKDSKRIKRLVKREKDLIRSRMQMVERGLVKVNSHKEYEDFILEGKAPMRVMQAA